MPETTPWLKGGSPPHVFLSLYLLIFMLEDGASDWRESKEEALKEVFQDFLTTPCQLPTLSFHDSLWPSTFHFLGGVCWYEGRGLIYKTNLYPMSVDR